MRVSYWSRLGLAFLLLTVSAARADDPKGGLAWVPDKEVLDELKSAPKENPARVERLRELYLQAGAKADDITLQEVKLENADAPVLHNVIVRKKGMTDSVIVVGGHLDKVPPGDGIIDDWSGACLATNLFQTIRGVETHHTFVFMGFAYEEAGLVGSRAYVTSLAEEDRKRIKAMVNLECLGVEDPFIWTNGSTDSLEVIAHRVADEHKLPLRDHVIQGVGADSIPFDRAGIPNITFDGLPIEQLGLIHSDRDTFSNIKPESYLNAYRLTAHFLVTLDKSLAEPAAKAPAAVPEKVPEKTVEDYIQAEMSKRHIPGLSLAVVRDGQVVLGKGYGLANVEHSVAATADTVYQIGSITKQFTATCIMMLVEEGKLSLDDPISKHLADTPDAWKDVTVRHLLNHTSGIKSYTSVPENMKLARLDRPKEEIVKSVAELPLEFAPGEKWSYNNTGYFLLGMIIERVSGQSFAAFLKERILAPLQMQATRVNDMREIVPNRAAGYSWLFGVQRNGDYSSMTWPFAAGAIVSTVADLAKWDAALYSETLLPQSALEQMWTATTLTGGKKADYGFGWGVGNYRGHKLVSHSGGIPGFSSDITRLVDDKLTVIVLANLDGANPAAIGRGVAAMYLPDLAPSAAKAVEDTEPQVTEMLKRIVRDTIAGKLDPEQFTPEMQKELFPDKAKQAKAALAALAAFRSLTLLERKQDGDTRRYRYQATFESGTLILHATLTDDSKIAGLLLTPE